MTDSRWHRTCGDVSLLNDVGQFVGEQFASPGTFGRESVRATDNMTANRVCLGADSPRGFTGPRIDVNSHSAEVVSETRLHEGACLLIK